MVGVVSFGPATCGSTTPGVYTRVTHFIGKFKVIYLFNVFDKSI